jgi:hypothetical protein
MRKRSKHKPKRLLDPLGFVLENSKTMSEFHGKHLLDLKIKNHAAMTRLTQGVADKLDLNDLIQAYNVMDAFRLLGVKGVEAEIKAAGAALRSIAERSKHIATGPEIVALNDFLDYHDELLEHVTTKQFTDAVTLARKIILSGKAYPIKEKT